MFLTDKFALNHKNYQARRQVTIICFKVSACVRSYTTLGMNSKHSKYKPLVTYVESTWQNTPDKNAAGSSGSLRSHFIKIGRIDLPGSFTSPNNAYFAGTQFYWDTYFTILGLVISGHQPLAKSMVDNLCFLRNKFGFVPARNSYTSIGRTQPPFLTQMAYEVYDHGGADRQWLDKIMTAAIKEYRMVWLSGRRFDNTSGLSRYNPKYLSGYLTVYESGWDRSVRFAGLGANLLPIDLNCQLYQYEADFLRWATMRRDKQAQHHWQTAMSERKKRINNYFWDEEAGFFLDNNLKTKNRCQLRTLAGFYPLWCGTASQKQADMCRKNLALFEHSGGLASTQELAYTNKQWDYPNGWAPLQWIVIAGLIRYGFHDDAARLTSKWLDCNLKVFKTTGQMWEKYDVVNCAVGLPGRYPTQPGFAWTNSVFLRLLHCRRN